jgi:RimJ/RimL family protein N-acetyltransferase
MHVVTALTVQEKVAMLGFLQEHAVRLPPSGDFQAFGSVSARTDELLGVVAFNGFWGHVCSIHTAGAGNWMSRSLIWRTFDYPFRQLDMRALMAPVAASNTRSVNFIKRMGFKEIHRVPNGWDEGDDLIVLQMLREDCPWLAKLDKHFLSLH